MVRITSELVRKRAEHNDGELDTLEEVSLHQQDIEKIEHLHRWCPRLRILYLQGNLIGKIENVGRLRELEYLNLALNNVERVEGLERCEALHKLDLTANFICDLTSITNLQDLPNLRELYLTGNPCTGYRGYREWVLCNLPGLEELDGASITRSERLRALQDLTLVHSTVKVDQQLALEARAKEREEYERSHNEKENDDTTDDEAWWRGASYHTPESRLDVHRRLAHRRHRQANASHDNSMKRREVRLFTNDGRPLNVNAAKLEFHFTEDEQNNSFTLEVDTYKYLDATLVGCEVEPWYVRVTVRGQVLQLVLLEEVRSDRATARRSQVTGHLLVTMPKLAPPRYLGNTCMPEKITPVGSLATRVTLQPQAPTTTTATTSNNTPTTDSTTSTTNDSTTSTSEVNYLEVSEVGSRADYTSIVGPSGSSSSSTSHVKATHYGRVATSTALRSPPERPNSPGFVDDVSVPPLE